MTVGELRAALQRYDDEDEVYVHVNATPGHTTVKAAVYDLRATAHLVLHCSVERLTKWGTECPTLVSLLRKGEQS